MAKENQRCERCVQKFETKGEIAEHHPLPRRFYGKGTINPDTTDLCNRCHREADTLTFELDAVILKELMREHGHKYRQRYTEAFEAFMSKVGVRILH
jgi:hypothetical protein